MFILKVMLVEELLEMISESSLGEMINIRAMYYFFEKVTNQKRTLATPSLNVTSKRHELQPPLGEGSCAWGHLP